MYLTLSAKYSERNFPLKASHGTGSSLSSMMDFMLIHQCSASLVSMYTAKVSMLSTGHIYASKILFISVSPWSATFNWVVLQKVLQTPLPDWRSGLKVVGRGSCPILLQLAEGHHVLFVSIFSSHPCSLHLLHHKLLLFQ